MQISVKGKQMDIGDALRTHVEDSLGTVVPKYFGDPMDASTVFSRENYLYVADITVHVGRGIQVQGHGEANEPYPAFDNAVEKVAKRLRRYKRRLRDHHTRAGEAAAEAARHVVFEGTDADDETEADQGADNPLVIAEVTTAIPRLTVGEAVVHLDLVDEPALMFRNSAHGGLNMVYRRPDGNVGWVDPAIGTEETVANTAS